ncbi:MAG: CvfD/Ygs/GSP13 family RNA-binding post-transcriptional regulator [Anaerorhabdus sp.]
MQYRIGEIVEGTVTGIQPYGAFIVLKNKTRGLVHISELSNLYVKDVAQFVSVGDKISVKIIDFDKETNQARLSLKAVRSGQFRKERNYHRYKATMPPMKMGFKSIEEKMDQWIKKAKEEL